MDYLQLRELYHDGIKGMKWGIRRYQNYDGTLTEEGRRRYNKNYSEDRAEGSLPTRGEDGNYYYTNKEGKRTLYKTRSEQLSDTELTDLNRRVQQENKLAAETSDAYEFKGPKADQALRDASRMAKDISDALPKGNGKVIKKDYSNLSDQELRNRINRLQLEDSYGKLSGDTKYVKSGSEKAREMLQTVGSVLAIAGSAVGLAYTIRKFREGNNPENTANHSDILDASDFLEHHGILGQKWGVRRFQNEDGSLTEEGKKRYHEDSQKLADMSTSLAELEDLTRQYDLRNALENAHKNNAKILMTKDDKKLWEDAYQLFLNLEEKYAKDNISTEIKTLDDGTDYIVSSIYDKKLGGTIEYYEPLLYDSNGKKYDEKNRLYNTTKSYNQQLGHSDELMHHGIKGQKWGIRRFQNPDGSLTEEGSARYGGKTHTNQLSDKEKADLDQINQISAAKNKLIEKEAKKMLLFDAAGLAAGIPAGIALGILIKSPVTGISVPIATMSVASAVSAINYRKNVNSYLRDVPDTPDELYKTQNKTQMSHLDILDEDENFLEHHGIKGQKWGLRRYQNDDGTLTEAGRLRYGGKTHVSELDEDELADLHAAREYQHKKKLAIGIGIGVGAAAAITIGATWLARRSQQRTDTLNQQGHQNDRNVAELIDVLDSKSSASGTNKGTVVDAVFEDVKKTGHHMHESDRVKPKLFGLPTPKSSSNASSYHIHESDRVAPKLFGLPAPKSSSNTSSYHMHEPDRVRPNLFSLPAPKSSKAYVKNGALYQYQNGKETLLGGGANSRYEYTINSAGQILRTIKKNFKPSWLGHADASDYLIFREMYFSSFDTLAHHGIKGQKWGVRRYQDENGNMTSEGKQRYRTNQGTKEIIGNSDSYSKLTGSNRRRYANYGKTSGAKRGFLIGLGTGAAAGAGKTIFDTVLNRNNLGSGEYTTNRIVNRFIRNTILGAFGGSVIGTLVGSVTGKKSAQAKLADKGQAYTNELLNTPLDRIARRH